MARLPWRAQSMWRPVWRVAQSIRASLPSFAAGQAGFTVVLFVLFNIIQPVGWTVGLVRIEDVAIGFAISLGVGLLFWPRGAATVLRENLAAAYGRSADYVVVAAGQIAQGGQTGSSGPAKAAADAEHRLDDAFRQALAERSAVPVNMESVGALVAGAARVRRTAQSLSALGRMADADTTLSQCGQNLDGEIHALRSWYITLGDSFIHFTVVPPPHVRDAQGRSRLLDCVRAAVVAAVTGRRFGPRSSCCGRPSTWTISGASNRTSEDQPPRLRKMRHLSDESGGPEVCGVALPPLLELG